MPLNRRRHRMFVTRNTEYHLRLDECVGVRDIESGEWFRHHAALRLRAVKLPSMGHEQQWVGRRIQFWGEAADVVTSPVTDVGRPPVESPDRYVSKIVAGQISA